MLPSGRVREDICIAVILKLTDCDMLCNEQTNCSTCVIYEPTFRLLAVQPWLYERSALPCSWRSRRKACCPLPGEVAVSKHGAEPHVPDSLEHSRWWHQIWLHLLQHIGAGRSDGIVQCLETTGQRQSLQVLDLAAYRLRLNDKQVCASRPQL